ncbi:MAG: flagellar biosynthesis anti-sigma factor FlgM [Candidatus Binatia bacterium]
MTKVTYKRRPGKGLSKLIENNKALDQAIGVPKTEIAPTVESVKFNLCKAARKTKKLTEPLRQKGHEFVAEKITQLKEIIAKGNYEVDPREVAKRMISAEIPWHLEKRKIQLMNLDLTELLALRRQRNCGGKNVAPTREINRNLSRHGTSSSFTNKSLHKHT